MTMIVVYGKILEKPRGMIKSLGIPMLTYMLTCTMCMGMWIGFLMTQIIGTSFGWFVGGCISSGTSYLLSKIVNDEGIVVNFKKG
jgi:hypothetical protein